MLPLHQPVTGQEGKRSHLPGMDDFQDDGGTRSWRANQATWRDSRVLDVSPDGSIKRTTPPLRAYLILAIAMIIGLPLLPVVLLLMAYVFDILTGRWVPGHY